MRERRGLPLPEIETGVQGLWLVLGRAPCQQREVEEVEGATALAVIAI